MWDLPGPGLEPVSPALAGRFLTTAPLRKSLSAIINTNNAAMNILEYLGKRECAFKTVKASVKLASIEAAPVYTAPLCTEKRLVPAALPEVHPPIQLWSRPG